MSSTQRPPIYRTSPQRMGRMMVIMLGICIAGGVIFFSAWDYWISMPAPVVAQQQAALPAPVQASPTGKSISVDLRFVESEDFRVYAFNALPDNPGNNPTINANVGDLIVFDVVNAGVSFHAFGVTADTEGIAGIIPGTEIAAATNPLKPDESGDAKFVPAEPGTYYYICTVPGHREQGMVGEIIVTEAGDDSTTESQETSSPIQTHNFDLIFVESEDFRELGFNALPGEEGANPDIRVGPGDIVMVNATNGGNSLHAFAVVTNPEDFRSTIWDSEIAAATAPLLRGQSGQVTFTAGAPGEYYYICTVPGHALQGMQGKFIVE